MGVFTGRCQQSTRTAHEETPTGIVPQFKEKILKLPDVGQEEAKLRSSARFPPPTSHVQRQWSDACEALDGKVALKSGFTCEGRITRPLDIQELRKFASPIYLLR